MTEPARILVVDDDEINRVILDDFISNLGHTPVLAENGLSALAQMREQIPDIVLLDIEMPAMDGYEVLERMKDDSSLRPIPVIMITSNDKMDSVVRCIEMGADDYLNKPFNATLLEARINASLENKHLRDQEQNYQQQIEKYNLNLEEQVRERTEQLTRTLKTKTKLSVAIALIVTVVVLGIAVLSYMSSRSAIEKNLEREIKEGITQTALNIKDTIAGADADVLFLSELPQVQGIIRAREERGVDAQANATYELLLEDFQQILLAILINNPQYWQIRYIDERGWERVRVDSINQNVRIVPKTELQKKSDEPYFPATMQLPAKAIYVSQMNLNRERGRIEVPHKPTMRFATPIFDAKGAKKGIIIINLFGSKILNQIKSQRGSMYLVNQHGFFLKHPDSAKEFGFELGADFKLAELHPGLLDNIQKEDEEVKFRREGGITYGFQKIYYDSQSKENFWIIVFDLPDK